LQTEFSVSHALDLFTAFIDGLTVEAQHAPDAGLEAAISSSWGPEPEAAPSGAATPGCAPESNMEGYHAKERWNPGRKPQKAAWTFNSQEMAQRLSQQLETENASSAARARQAADGSANVHTIDRSAGPASTDALTRPIAPPEHLVQRLAAALMTPRPWMRITNPELARAYFEARARHMLATASDDPLALIEREERGVSPAARASAPSV
jgi:hypothetical protein